MSIITRELSIIISSNAANGAKNITNNGATFDIILNRPLIIPREAIDCTIYVYQASVWNTAENIAAVFNNNKFSFTTLNVANPGTFLLTIPDGIYSLGGLNSFISSQFSNLGLPANLITIDGDESTQKSVLVFLTAGDYVDFTVADSVREILGFNSRLAPVAPQIAGWSEFSDNRAAFNRVNNFLILSDIVSTGIPVNNQSRGILVSVPILSNPGSLINYNPQQIVSIDGNELIGHPRLNFTFNLTDQLLRPAITNEDWSFVMVIKYQMMTDDKTYLSKIHF